MNISECATFLKSYIDAVPEEALLEYLLAVLTQPDESQASKDDVLYSLLPELGLLEDDARKYVIGCLCGTQNMKGTASGGNTGAGVFGFASGSSDSPRDRSNSNPRDNYKESSSSTGEEEEDENEIVRVELHALLCNMGCEAAAETLDSTIVGFLLNTFGNGQDDDESTGEEDEREPELDEDEQLDLLRAYLDGLPEENLAEIVVYFKRCAAERKENRAIQAGIAADTRASELNSRLQSIATDKRVSRPAISQEEAAERARLVDQFGETEVRAKYDAKGKEVKPANLVMFVQNPKLESKVRYREGVVVTHGGGKFIIEKEEEYDSGIRGRVKSKGKRGAGAGKGL